MFKNMCLAFSIIILCNTIRTSDASCTFPSELTGIWYSSHKGQLNFTSTTLYDYPVFLSALVNSMNFNCHERDGYLYMLKSTYPVFAFGQLLDTYICMQLYRISSSKYYYYLGTSISNTNNDYIYGRYNGTLVSMSEACNRGTPYETGTFITLVKEGAFSSKSALATCPTSILASYSSVAISDYSGTTTCTGNSLNVCSDKTALDFTYQSCTSGLAFSSLGYFYCIYHKVVGGVTYLMVWNNDTTVDGSTTYRSTCLVLTSDSSTLHATEHPHFCSDTTQSSTYVPSPGIKYIMTSQSETCVVKEEGGQSGVYYFLITLSVIVVVGGVFFAVVMYMKYKNKIRMMELDVYKKETISRPVSSLPWKSRSTVSESSIPKNVNDYETEKKEKESDDVEKCVNEPNDSDNGKSKITFEDSRKEETTD